MPSIFQIDDAIAVGRPIFVVRYLDDRGAVSFRPLSRSMIIFPWLECRLPVGSSASSNFGPNHRPGYRNDCCCPPNNRFGNSDFFADNLKTVQCIGHQASRSAFLDIGVTKGANRDFRSRSSCRADDIAGKRIQCIFVQLTRGRYPACEPHCEQIIFSIPVPVQHRQNAHQRHFPAPDGPMMVMNCPSPISRLIRRSTQVFPAP